MNNRVSTARGAKYLRRVDLPRTFDVNKNLRSYEDLREEARSFARECADYVSVKNGLDMNKVMNRLGFQEISFEELSWDLQQRMQRPSIYGAQIYSKSNLGQVFVAKSQPDTYYFFNRDLKNSANTFSWSKVYRDEEGNLRLHELNHDSSLEEVIHLLGVMEIIHAQNPNHLDLGHDKDSILVPSMVTGNVKHLQKEIKAVLKGSPEWEKLPPAVPGSFDELMRQEIEQDVEGEYEIYLK